MLIHHWQAEGTNSKEKEGELKLHTREEVIYNQIKSFNLKQKVLIFIWKQDIFDQSTTDWSNQFKHPRKKSIMRLLVATEPFNNRIAHHRQLQHTLALA